MIIHPVAEEILEKLWVETEQRRSVASVDELRLPGDRDEVNRGLAELVSEGSLLQEPLRLSAAGEERARAIVRRHRLAEILFAEVLELGMVDAEASACEFEHMLSERVVDRVCTFLGHPPKCPHGNAIPQGSCCRMFERRVEPLINRLIDLPIGSTGTVVFIAPKSPARLNRLAVFGVVPGTAVRLLQRKPSVVVRCGETSVAIEEEMARDIFVRAETA